MGFVYRKSFKVMPGVRMTVSKSGISTSVGGGGLRVTRTASGRTMRTVSLPGSGLRYTTTVGSGTAPRRQRRSTVPPPAAPVAPAKPGLLSPRWERDLFAATIGGEYARLPAVAEQHPEVAPLAATIEGLLAFQSGDHDRARMQLAYAWVTGFRPEEHPFTKKYLGLSAVTVGVADGVAVTMPLSRDAVGLALAELYQEANDVPRAIDVVEHVEPSHVAAVSLAELYLDARRYADTVDLTNGVSNNDDATALLMTFRGIALREQGHPDAAREAFKEALRFRSRDAKIRHRALLERAATYTAEGKRGPAKRDLERVLAEDASYPGLQDALVHLQRD